MKLKQKCIKCNRAMEMYYTPYCPRCFDQKIEIKKCINLIQTLRHLELVHKSKGYKDRMWEKFIEDKIRGNDSYFSYTVLSKADIILYGDSDDVILNNYLISLNFKENEDFLFRVSW